MPFIIIVRNLNQRRQPPGEGNGCCIFMCGHWLDVVLQLICWHVLIFAVVYGSLGSAHTDVCFLFPGFKTCFWHFVWDRVLKNWFTRFVHQKQQSVELLSVYSREGFFEAFFVSNYPGNLFLWLINHNLPLDTLQQRAVLFGHQGTAPPGRVHVHPEVVLLAQVGNLLQRVKRSDHRCSSRCGDHEWQCALGFGAQNFSLCSNRSKFSVRKSFNFSFILQFYLGDPVESCRRHRSGSGRRCPSRFPWMRPASWSSSGHPPMWKLPGAEGNVILLSVGNV